MDETLVAEVEKLRHEVARKREELSHAERHLAEREAELSWQTLLQDVSLHPLAQQVKAALRDAIDAFKATLCAPDGYDPEETGTPYEETDDFGDFSLIEAAVDDALERIEEAADTGDVQGALIALLALTIEFGTIAEEEGVFTGALPAGEYEELRESIAESWGDLIQRSDVADDDKNRWLSLLRTRLGPPYDAVSKQ